MTTGKTIALTRRIFVGKVMSLLLNMLSRLVIIFLPKSQRLLISWLQSPSAVVLEPSRLREVAREQMDGRNSEVGHGKGGVRDDLLHGCARPGPALSK